MNELIDGLFEVQEHRAVFEQLDDRISSECERQLQAYRDMLSPQDYEAIRDVAFSVAAISKRSAFEIGFKTATRLIVECVTDEQPT